jgi:acyl-coenzyme A synthetase/AMP-(fatty) acid ligase
MATCCASRLAAYKVPRELRCIDAMPRNANGKILKTDLRKLA